MANCICGKKLEPGQKYCSRECGGKMHLLDCEIIDQKYFNYAVGVLQGSGTFFEKGTVVIEVNSGEAPFASVLKKELDKAFSIKPELYNNSRKDNGRKRYQLSYNSKSLQSKLKDVFGEFPKRILEIDYPKEFIAGWFDTRGVVYETVMDGNLFMINTDAQGMLETVKRELKKLDIHYIYIQHEKGEYLAIKEQSRDVFTDKIPLKNPYRIPSVKIKRTSRYRQRGELQNVLIYYLFSDAYKEAKDLANRTGELKRAISTNLARLKDKGIIDLIRRNVSWSINDEDNEND